jgi:hypothetical protein
MTELLPCVAQADADREGPRKRTRRPALSCIECRMRKVRCDRKEPCSACIKIKSEKCTYRPSRPGIRKDANRAPSIQRDNIISSLARPPLQSNSPTEGTSAGLTRQLDASSSELVAALFKENERLRSALGQGASHEVDVRPISDIVTDLPGSFQKSKFFGQSHWMNAMEPVRSAPAWLCGHLADNKAVWVSRRAEYLRQCGHRSCGSQQVDRFIQDC